VKGLFKSPGDTISIEIFLSFLIATAGDSDKKECFLSCLNSTSVFFCSYLGRVKIHHVFPYFSVLRKNNKILILYYGKKLALAPPTFPVSDDYGKIPQKKISFLLDGKHFSGEQVVSFSKRVITVLEKNGQSYFPVVPNRLAWYSIQFLFS
jgi:hypothetical protein